MHDPHYNPVVPGHVPAVLVRDYNVFDYESQDPYQAAHALLGSQAPEVFWTRNNGGHWVVTGAAATAELGADAALFSATRMMVPDHQNAEPPSFPPLDVDPPMHREYRNVLAPLFTPPRIALLEKSIREVTDKLISAVLERGECEFVEDFAAQMPVVVFLSLLDLPQEDRHRLRAIAHRILNPVDDDHRNTPLQELSAYIRPIVEDRAAHPRNDIISLITAKEVAGRPQTVDEMEKLSRTLLLGGLDTVASMLTYFARYLADSPAVRQRLRAEPKSIKPAVEEILRRYPVSNIGRITMRDTTFRGVAMKKGDHVMWPVGMFNLDERRFPRALDVDIDRKPTTHATFGVGEHFCVGSMLARTELAIFAQRWLERIPEFHVKPGVKLRYRGGFNVNLKELPLVIGPGPNPS
jgi:camphor 5-monooxygenase